MWVPSEGLKFKKHNVRSRGENIRPLNWLPDRGSQPTRIASPHHAASYKGARWGPQGTYAKTRDENGREKSRFRRSVFLHWSHICVYAKRDAASYKGARWGPQGTYAKTRDENGREKSRFRPSVFLHWSHICVYANRDGKWDEGDRERDGKRLKVYPARICGIPFFYRNGIVPITRFCTSSGLRSRPILL
jgi:hypothetical protein